MVKPITKKSEVLSKDRNGCESFVRKARAQIEPYGYVRRF